MRTAITQTLWRARVLLTAVTILFFGCEPLRPPPPRHMTTATLNGARAEIGLRLVKDSWIPAIRKESNDERWTDGNDGRLKMVQMTPDGALKWEQDYYPTGRIYLTVEGSMFEELIIHFDYTTRSVSLRYSGINRLIIEMVKPFNDDRVEPNSTSNALAIADEILTMWGMTRL